MKLTVRYDMDSTVWILWDYNVWYGTEILFLRYLRCSCFHKNYVLIALNFHESCMHAEPGWFHWKQGFKPSSCHLQDFPGCREHCDLISLGEVLRAVILQEKQFVRHKRWGQTLGFEVNLLLLSAMRGHRRSEPREEGQRQRIPAGTCRVESFSLCTKWLEPCETAQPFDIETVGFALCISSWQINCNSNKMEVLPLPRSLVLSQWFQMAPWTHRCKADKLFFMSVYCTSK